VSRFQITLIVQYSMVGFENYKHTHTKPNLLKLKPGSGRLLHHPARKWIGPVQLFTAG